jgi:phosphoglucosamine mutase
VTRLFGTSGVRGTWKEGITPGLFLGLGRALSVFLGGRGRVLVGRDTRTSGEALQAALVSGILSGGCDVLEAGVIPTPVLAFSTKLLGANAGAMITASHNPPEYNGLKLWSGDGMAFTPEQEGEIERILHENPKGVEWFKVGAEREVEALPAYFEEILRRFSLERRFKVVVDCGNGAASSVTPLLLRELGCTVVTLHSHPDGFPGRGLEPTPENLIELSKEVRDSEADLGIAHDGDADRVVAVDERGRVVDQDKLLALVAGQEGGGGTVVTTVDASRVVERVVEERGGRVIRTKVGDVNVALACREHKASFGGEPCGAWIFPGVHLAPDGPLGAVVLLKMLETGKPLSEMVDELPQYVMKRKKLPCPDARKQIAMEKFMAAARNMGGDLSTVDGIRVSLPEGWILVRPSGTEPLIRITVEGEREDWVREQMEKTVRILTAKEG